MNHRARMAARSDQTLDTLNAQQLTNAALAAISGTPLGHDDTGNTITFGNVMAMHFTAPDEVTRAIESAKANVAAAVTRYAQETLDNGPDGRARSRANLDIGRNFKAYSQALVAAREYLPGLSDDNMNSPLLGIAAFAGDMADDMTKAVDAQLRSQGQGKAAVR